MCWSIEATQLAYKVVQLQLWNVVCGRKQKIKHLCSVCNKLVKSNTIFIARQHTDAQYWYSKSVRLSVRNVLVSDENGLTYRHIFSPYGFHQHQTSSRNYDGVTPCGGAKCRWGIKISRFSTNKWLYLTNDARHRHSYYGRWIGTRMRSIKRCHFQWP